jgi:hypothetical protein
MEEIRAERCLNLRIREEEWSQLERLKFFSFSQKFPWDEVVRKKRKRSMWSMWSMEKAGYETMFKLFMSTTFRMELEPWPMDDLNFRPYLMCFLTSDGDELRKCNDFMVRFVYTIAPSPESRANETRCFATTSGTNKDDVLLGCQKIMVYGT